MKSPATLYLHIGLHKTGTTYLQNVLLENKDLILKRDNILFPDIDEPLDPGSTTRPGANSGHSVFTRPRFKAQLLDQLLDQCETAKPKSVIISSENFTLWHRNTGPKAYIDRFRNHFEKIVVVLVLRRQDAWIDSYYRQIIDGFADYETRRIDQFVDDLGAQLFDFHGRFKPWQTEAGPENFIVGSYDDLVAADSLLAWFARTVGISPDTVQKLETSNVARYPSIGGLDTYPIRLLNNLRLRSRDVRTLIVRDICAAQPRTSSRVLSYNYAEAIRILCHEQNEWIARNWMDGNSKEFVTWDSSLYPSSHPACIDSALLESKMLALLNGLQKYNLNMNYYEQFCAESEKTDRLRMELDKKNSKIRKLRSQLPN